MKRVIFFCLLTFGMASLGFTQTLTQTIRGQVLDQDTRSPLSGAMVILVDSLLRMGAETDDEGRFAIANIPVGRRTLRVSYTGYAERQLPNLTLTTGKEVFLTIELQENVTQLDAVEIKAEADRAAAQNDMATVSARSFDVEGAARFAGTINDPARMAANFAGVSSGGDFRNDIIIRGNSPLGLLWRLEGVDIPNPNHFASQGSNGGPVSMLNYNLLATSDFLTGAFPAEYGNATSGAFDLKMRAGNTAKRETAFQIGFNGFELMTEGPLSKKTGASYVISYRYSTLAVFQQLGFNFGDLGGVPYFQDLSFKVNVPTRKAGTFSLWGLGGLNSIDILESRLSDSEWYGAKTIDYSDTRQQARLGVVGLTHTYVIGQKAFLRTTLAQDYTRRTVDLDSLTVERRIFPNYDEAYEQNKLTLGQVFTYKLNARHVFKAGYFAERIGLNLRDSLYIGILDRFITLRAINETLYQFRPYAQYQWRPTDRLTINAGLYYQHLFLNSTQALDPRLGVRYKLSPKTAISLAYGMHHQNQMLPLYFNRNAAGQTPNRDLPMFRSQHLVAGFDHSFTPNFRVKLETYWQYLDNIAVDTFPSTFSAVNIGLGFDRLPEATGLISTGTAQNLGLELTVEKFFSQGWYALLTASVFDSRYTPSDGKTYSTGFNNNYVVNLLGGYEWNLKGRKDANTTGRHVLFADIKTTVAGGIRYTPIDLQASFEQKNTVRDLTRPYTEQARPYFRFDLKMGYRLNFRRMTHEFSMTLQNVSNNQNVLVNQYNLFSNQVIERYQTGFFPIPQYKLTF